MCVYLYVSFNLFVFIALNGLSLVCKANQHITTRPWLNIIVSCLDQRDYKLNPRFAGRTNPNSIPFVCGKFKFLPSYFCISLVQSGVIPSRFPPAYFFHWSCCVNARLILVQSTYMFFTSLWVSQNRGIPKIMGFNLEVSIAMGVLQ